MINLAQRSKRFVFCLVTALGLFTASNVDAAFIKKAKLAPADVRSSVATALLDLTGGSISLLDIIGVHQSIFAQLQKGPTYLNNTAIIYASLAGSLSIPGGVPIVYDDDVEEIHCTQLHDRRWLCRFLLLSSYLTNQQGLGPSWQYFFIEK